MFGRDERFLDFSIILSRYYRKLTEVFSIRKCYIFIIIISYDFIILQFYNMYYMHSISNIDLNSNYFIF